VRKKNIAFIIHSLSSGGAERVISTLSNQLIDTYNISIITFLNAPPFYPLDKRIKLLACFDNINPSSNIFQALNTNYGLYKKISGFLKSEAIDLCIGFLTTSNVLSVLAARSNNIPVIVSERINPNSSKKPFVWERLRKFTYPKADYVIIQTQKIRGFFSSWIEDSKLRILANPLSPNLKYDQTLDDSRDNIVLNVGRLTDQKGQDMLIKAFSDLNPKGWKLIIVGEGIKRPIYEDLIRKLEMTEKIFLVGSEKNISKYYNSAKIFAFTSRFEGFPNALIEAMYMNLPCISTDCPTGPSELISDGLNGFLVPIDDQKSFREKLNMLVNNQDLRIKFSENGKAEVERFSVEKVVEEWEGIIVLALEKNVSEK